jgi:hypothetical protein
MASVKSNSPGKMAQEELWKASLHSIFLNAIILFWIRNGNLQE